MRAFLSIFCAIAALAAAAKLQFEAGAPEDAFFEIPDFVASDPVAEADTPGSLSWYKHVDAIRLMQYGRLYRDGILVTNAMPPVGWHYWDELPSVYRSRCSRYGYCYDISDMLVCGDRLPESDMSSGKNAPRYYPASLNQFDLKYYACDTNGVIANYRFVATNYVDVTLPYPCALPRSAGFNPRSYATVLDTYAAYFERLYYASQGDTNAWNEIDYGPIRPNSFFKFNLSNDVARIGSHFDLCYPTNYNRVTSHRMLEYDNLVRLRDAVRHLLPSGTYVRYHEDNDPDNPSWLYRPGWLLDGQAAAIVPGSLYYAWPDYAWLWWASSVDPPRVIQRKGEVDAYIPTEFGFLPEIDLKPIDEINERWETYCVTLDAGASGTDGICLGNGDTVSYPLGKLSDMIRGWYVPGMGQYALGDLGISDWITNALPAAGQSCAPVEHYDSRLDRYLDLSWGLGHEGDLAHDTRRVLNTQYTGVNQLLAMMDTTIHIPHQLFESYRECHEAAACASYVTEPVTVECYYDADSESIMMRRDISGTYAARASDIRSSDTVTSVEEHGQEAYLSVDGYDISQRDRCHAGGTTFSGDIYLTEDAFDAVADGRYVIIGIKADLDRLVVQFVPESRYRDYSDAEIQTVSVDSRSFAADLETTNVTFSFEKKLDCSYQYCLPATNRIHVGQTQPGFEADDRCESAKAGMLARLCEYAGSGPESTETDYLSSHAEYYTQTPKDVVQAHLDTLLAAQRDKADAFFGFRFSDPLLMFEFPAAMTNTVSASRTCHLTDVKFILEDGLIGTAEVYFDVTLGAFVVSNSVYAVTNGTSVVVSNVYDCVAVATENYLVAEDGWIFPTSASTNVLSRDAVSMLAVTNAYGSVSLDEELTDTIPIMATRYPRQPWYTPETAQVTTTSNIVTISEYTEITVVNYALTVTNVTHYFVGGGQSPTNAVSVGFSAYQTVVTNSHPADITSSSSVVEETVRLTDPYATFPSHELVICHKTMLLDKDGSNVFIYHVIRNPYTGDLEPYPGEGLPLRIGHGEFSIEPDYMSCSPYRIDFDNFKTYRSWLYFAFLTKVKWAWHNLKLKGSSDE